MDLQSRIGLSLQISKETKKNVTELLVLGLLVCLLARSIAFVTIGHGLDDLVYWATPTFGVEQLWLHGAREGRFVYPWLAQAAENLGVDLPRSPTVSAFVLSMCLAASGVFICYLWRIEKDRLACALVVAIFVAHPYFTDIYVWKMAMFTGGIPFAVALLAMLIARASWAGVILGAMMLVLALGVHQLPLGLCGGVWIMAVTFDLIRSKGVIKRLDTAASFRMAVMLGIGTIVYYMVAKLLIISIGMESVLNRDVLIIFSDPGLMFARTAELMKMMMFRDLLVSMPVRMTLVAMLLLSLMPLVVDRAKTRSWKSLIPVAAFPLAITGSVVLAIALTVVPHAWVPSYRNMAGVSVIWAAGVASIALMDLPRQFRWIIGLGAAFIVFAFVGTSNEILSDHLRQSERDRLLMSRIASSLNALPGFANADSLEFVGTSNSTLTGLATAADISRGWGAYGTTFSPFAAFFGQTSYLHYLYRDVTGSPKFHYTSATMEAAIERCRLSEYWPSPASVSMQDGLAVVCLSAPAVKETGPFDVKYPGP